MKTVAFCEIEPYCRAVLRKHWPEVPCYDDVRTLTAERLRADGIEADVICGGFPCQDISLAGKGAGIDGAQSGLWAEFARLIGDLRPRYAIVENVSALLNRGLGRVLGDLAAIGYDAEWHCISAAAVGAPHRRDRIWIVAYPEREQLRQQPGWSGGARGAGAAQPAEYGENGDVANADGDARHEWRTRNAAQEQGRRHADRGSIGANNVADAECDRRQQSTQVFCRRKSILAALSEAGASEFWQSEPDVGRVAHGVPSRVDRLRALGNAVVPQIPEAIGRAIMAYEA